MSFNLLQENGDKLLQENGSNILITRSYDFLVSVGSFTLTGFTTLLKIGRKLLCSVGEFTLTGYDILLKRGYTIVNTVGEFTLTLNNVIISLGRKLIAEVNSFILTGYEITFKGKGGWIWKTLPKNTANFSNTTKNGGDWINQKRTGELSFNLWSPNVRPWLLDDIWTYDYTENLTLYTNQTKS
jgi:hypothetical protein